MSGARTVRIVPDLRSSVVEERPPGQVLLFTSRRTDVDADLLDDDAVRPFTWTRLLAVGRERDLELIEVAEPLWLAEWVRALRCVVVVRVLRAVLPGRGRVRVATYAIENLDVRERVGVRALDGRPVLASLTSRVATAALGVSLLCLDRIVFGTTGAAENYRRAFGFSLRRVRHTVLTPRIDACRVCGPPVAAAQRERTVLFLGAPSERKGFGVLMAAWEHAGAAERGWRLVVADPDGQPGPSLPAGVTIRVAPPRRVVHELLRSGAVVAMPSVRRRRWREQIGLPLVEGLAHGCRVVTTTETGLADDLRGHPGVVVTVPGDARSLADGLRRAMAGPAPDPDSGPGHTDRDAPIRAGHAGHTKRDVMQWWLS